MWHFYAKMGRINFREWPTPRVRPASSMASPRGFFSTRCDGLNTYILLRFRRADACHIYHGRERARLLLSHPMRYNRRILLLHTPFFGFALLRFRFRFCFAYGLLLLRLRFIVASLTVLLCFAYALGFSLFVGYCLLLILEKYFNFMKIHSEI